MDLLTLSSSSDDDNNDNKFIIKVLLLLPRPQCFKNRSNSLAKYVDVDFVIFF